MSFEASHLFFVFTIVPFILCQCASHQAEQAGSTGNEEIDLRFSGEPHAEDEVFTVEANLVFNKESDDKSLILKTEKDILDLSASWPNYIAPEDLSIEIDRKYRVTLIRDNRLHPTILFGKYGTISPTVSLIETLDGTLIYDGSMCPKHQIKTQRKRVRLSEVNLNKPPPIPYQVRIKNFPYGCVSVLQFKRGWAPDTRETINGFVCEQCLIERAAYLKGR